MNNRELGKLGETFAENYLNKNGVEVIERNYFTKFGEIDLIGIEKETIIFIEVKLRKNLNFGYPEEGVNQLKLRRMYKVAQIFLLNSNLLHSDCRFDVVSVLFDSLTQNAKIKWLKNQLFY